MINRAFKAIHRSDVVLLVIDTPAGITDQDRVIAKRIAEDGRACVIIGNKWDMVKKTDKTYQAGIDHAKDALNVVNWAEVLFVSATNGTRCEKILDAILRANRSHKYRISTSSLNEVMRAALDWQRPPVQRNAIGKIYYSSQVSTSPPSIALFCNNPKLFSENYKRYLDKKLRESLNLQGTPVRWYLRGKTIKDVTNTLKKISKNTGKKVSKHE